MVQVVLGGLSAVIIRGSPSIGEPALSAFRHTHMNPTRKLHPDLRRARLNPRVGALLVSLGLLVSACGAGTADTVTTQVPSPDTTSEPNVLADEPAGSGTDNPTSTKADGGLRIIVQPDSSGEMPGDLEIGCRSGPTFPASALEGTRPLAGSGLEEVGAAIRVFLDGGEGQFWPQDGWQILHQADAAVLLVHVERTGGSGEALDESRVAFMTVEHVNGDWKWAGASSSGPCPLRTSLPQGLNTVEWRIDPSAEPLTPNSTQIGVLATEQECVSGQAMGDRLLGPEVVITETAVLIAFAANPPPGGSQTCPGNPELAVVVELPEPLGDREVLDGLALAGNLEDFLN